MPSEGSGEGRRLKTLEEADAEAAQRHQDALRRGHPNGIACPKCGAELHDTMMMLLSCPPKMCVRCVSGGCDFQGHRAT